MGGSVQPPRLRHCPCLPRPEVELHEWPACAKGKGSAVEVEITTFNVHTFRAGRVIRIELFTKRDPALEAGGLTKKEEEKR